MVNLNKEEINLILMLVTEEKLNEELNDRIKDIRSKLEKMKDGR